MKHLMFRYPVLYALLEEGAEGGAGGVGRAGKEGAEGENLKLEEQNGELEVTLDKMRHLNALDDTLDVQVPCIQCSMGAGRGGNGRGRLRDGNGRQGGSRGGDQKLKERKELEVTLDKMRHLNALDDTLHVQIPSVLVFYVLCKEEGGLETK